MEIFTIGFEEQLRLLRQKADPVKDINGEIAALAESMIDTMIKGDGIGLAGPQVGRLTRIFTLKIGDNDPMVFINPEITATSADLSSYEEGCLSIPGQYADVSRPAQIQIQAWNTRGRPFTIEADDILATVIQHELDHLNGVLFIDHLTERKRKKILGRFDVDPAEYPEAE
jgi:peptide deformylase